MSFEKIIEVGLDYDTSIKYEDGKAELLHNDRKLVIDVEKSIISLYDNKGECIAFDNVAAKYQSFSEQEDGNIKLGEKLIDEFFDEYIK